jgi:hypothetical protein
VPTLAAQLSACGCRLPWALAGVRFAAARLLAAGPFLAAALVFEAAPAEALLSTDPVLPPARAFRAPRAFNGVPGDLAMAMSLLVGVEQEAMVWSSENKKGQREEGADGRSRADPRRGSGLMLRAARIRKTTNAPTDSARDPGADKEARRRSRANRPTSARESTQARSGSGEPGPAGTVG